MADQSNNSNNNFFLDKQVDICGPDISESSCPVWNRTPDSLPCVSCPRSKLVWFSLQREALTILDVLQSAFGSGIFCSSSATASLA